jgi:hypothetical protein
MGIGRGRRSYVQVMLDLLVSDKHYVKLPRWVLCESDDERANRLSFQYYLSCFPAHIPICYCCQTNF